MTVRENRRKNVAIPKFARKSARPARVRDRKPFMAKLDEPTVRRIRAEAKHWPLRVLSKRYGVKIATISEIINRLSWAHVV